MPSADRRKRQRLELRTKILAPARFLTLEHGFEGLTMRRVAERVEYSPGALYWHFKDKRALVQALVAEDYWEFARVIREAMNVVDPVERLRRGAAAMVHYGLTHEDRYRLIFLMPREAGAQEFPAPPVEAPEDAYSIVQRAVRDAVATGRFAAPITDVDLIAQSLWSTIHGVLTLHIVRGQDHWIPWRPARQTAKFLTDLLFEALLVRRSADPPKAKAKSRKAPAARRRKSK